MCIELHVTYPYSGKILIKLEFSRQTAENIKISNFMKIRPVGAELFYVGGQQKNGRASGS